MRTTTVSLVLLLAGCNPPAEPEHVQQQSQGKSDLDRLQGTWKCLDRTHLVQEIHVKGQKAELISYDLTSSTYEIRLNERRSPKEMDFIGSNGRLLYIYDLNGDELEIAGGYGGDGSRPADFRVSASLFRRQR